MDKLNYLTFLVHKQRKLKLLIKKFCIALVVLLFLVQSMIDLSNKQIQLTSLYLCSDKTTKTFDHRKRPYKEKK